MSHEFINLLPPDRLRAFRRGYFLRVATVALLLGTLLVVIHGVFLLPSYLYASSEITARERAASGEGAEAPTTASAAATLAALKSDATYLNRLTTAPSASAALRAVLSVPRPGVSLQSFTYTPPAPGNGASAKMLITGTASTREALRAYDLALTGAAFVSSVDLPVSAYAKEADIAFTLTLAGTLAPTP
jgi:hypothetical protein